MIADIPEIKKVQYLFDDFKFFDKTTAILCHRNSVIKTFFPEYIL